MFLVMHVFSLSLDTYVPGLGLNSGKYHVWKNQWTDTEHTKKSRLRVKFCSSQTQKTHCYGLERAASEVDMILQRRCMFSIVLCQREYLGNTYPVHYSRIVLCFSNKHAPVGSWKHVRLFQHGYAQNCLYVCNVMSWHVCECAFL